jgi:hypothetical protein
MLKQVSSRSTRFRVFIRSSSLRPSRVVFFSGLTPLLAGQALARWLLFPVWPHVDLVAPAAALGAEASIATRIVDDLFANLDGVPDALSAT